MSYSTQDLHKFLSSLQDNKEEKDITKYKYVIYARKSSEGDERQIRSLPDQIIECQALVNSKKIPITNIALVQEKQSAKESGIRPKFTKMLEDIKKGKYDGIIAWHPDRLARNMKEAGEIIDMIDREIIKDLQFVSFTFENSSSGKMLLGISFVLSKQYSDKLSDDVRRGIKRSITEGKYLNKAKHGYYRDINKMLRPDIKTEKYSKDNFSLIKSAWQMRLEGETEQIIAEYLNEAGYERSNGCGEITHAPSKMTKQNISKIFRDTFYCGILKYGDKYVDLENVYNDFIPMISVDEFLKINKLSDITKAFQAKNRGTKESIKADFLRGIVFCGHCGEEMTATAPTKLTSVRKVNYFYFRCDTPGCKITLNKSRKVKQNVRGKVILDFVDQFLKNNKIPYKKAYKHYVEEMKIVSENENKKLENARKSLQANLTNTADRIKTIKKLMENSLDDIEVLNSFKKDLKEKEHKLKNLQKGLNEIKKAKLEGSKVVLTYKEFVELYNNLPITIEKTKAIQDKDKIIRKLFLNFTLKNKKVASYQLNQPFEEFYNMAVVSSSRSGGT
ncbi:MAG TPA: recombinase family protein [Candidatus Woesebacteria bacterium]|nr:recombinase family protein [Candidatus Woesebacteria bacterium]